MSQGLESKENTRPPQRVQRHNCRKRLIEDLMNACAALIIHAGSTAAYTENTLWGLRGLDNSSSASQNV